MAGVVDVDPVELRLIAERLTDSAAVVAGFATQIGELEWADKLDPVVDWLTGWQRSIQASAAALAAGSTAYVSTERSNVEALLDL